MANSFKRKLSRTIGTSVTAVGSYTVGSATEVTVIGLAVSNVTAAQIIIEASVYDGANDTYLIKDAPVPSGGSLVIVGGDQKVVLEVGDSIRVKSDTASSVDVVMSILEIT
jgi:hypothetical protein